MPIHDEELLAAVSGGIDAAAPTEIPPTSPKETTDDEVDETGDTDSGEGDAGADGDASAGVDDGAAGESVPADADGDADGKDEGEELDADGKPVAKAGATDPEVDPATGKPYTPEALAAKKAADEKEAFRKAQVEDPINAPIPKYLKETTQKRMTKLVEIAKDVTAKLESANKDRSEILGMITDTGATATQYTQALQYLKMVNSRDPAQIKAAINVMQQELTALSRMAGVPVAGVDHLANHADLKAAVEAKQITPELAQEIAAGREQRVVQTQQVEMTQQQQQAAQQEHAAGVQALNEIGRQLAARDPNYRTKAVEVLKTIQVEMQKLPPSRWAQAFLVAYTTHQPARAAAPVVKKAPVVPKNQPLRGNNPSGGQQSAPKTLDEAISMGIAAGTRRR